MSNGGEEGGGEGTPPAGGTGAHEGCPYGGGGRERGMGPRLREDTELGGLV